MMTRDQAAAEMQRYARGHAINAERAADRARRTIFGSVTERRQAELEAAHLQETAAFTSHISRICAGATEPSPSQGTNT